MSGVKGRSGRRSFDEELNKRIARNNAISKSYKIINDQLSKPIADKQSIALAGNIVLKDIGNDKRSPENTFDNRKLIINIDHNALTDSISKLQALTNVIDIEVKQDRVSDVLTQPLTETMTKQASNPSDNTLPKDNSINDIDISNASSREDDI